MTVLDKTLLAAIGAYQKLVSPVLSRSCRYDPSCSSYAASAIEKYGAWRGGLRAVRRVARCHPWHDGGYDPVD